LIDGSQDSDRVQLLEVLAMRIVFWVQTIEYHARVVKVLQGSKVISSCSVAANDEEKGEPQGLKGKLRTVRGIR
jgi:hypothetical protein